MKHKYHIKKVTVSLLALICLFILSIQAAQANPWWKEGGDWDWSHNNGARWTIEDYFKINEDDAIRIGGVIFKIGMIIRLIIGIQALIAIKLSLQLMIGMLMAMFKVIEMDIFLQKTTSLQ